MSHTYQLFNKIQENSNGFFRLCLLIGNNPLVQLKWFRKGGFISKFCHKSKMKQTQNISSVRCNYILSLVSFSVSFFTTRNSENLSLMHRYSFSIHFGFFLIKNLHVAQLWSVIRTEWFHSFLENQVLLTSQLF